MNTRQIINKIDREELLRNYFNILRETSPNAICLLYFFSLFKYDEVIGGTNQLIEDVTGLKRTKLRGVLDLLLEKKYLRKIENNLYIIYSHSFEGEQIFSEEKNYCVYLHSFPNGKKYVGITKDIEKRWTNGLGYKDNSAMWSAIIKYGWDNIEHKILAKNLTKASALEIERVEIQNFDSIKNGYNRI